MAIKIDTNGEVTDLGFYPDPKVIHNSVEGYFQIVMIRPAANHDGKLYHYMYVNEEGRMKGLVFNGLATAIAGKEIVGNIVLMDEDDQRKDMEA